MQKTSQIMQNFRLSYAWFMSVDSLFAKVTEITLELHYILIQGDLAGFSPSKRTKMESIEKCSPSRPLFTSTPLETAGSVEKLPNSPIFSSKPLPRPPVSVESDGKILCIS